MSIEDLLNIPEYKYVKHIVWKINNLHSSANICCFEDLLAGKNYFDLNCDNCPYNLSFISDDIVDYCVIEDRFLRGIK